MTNARLLVASHVDWALCTTIQGLDDEFLEQKQLLPHDFVDACKAVHQDVQYNERRGYNHSYFFIQSFLEVRSNHHMLLIDLLRSLIPEL
jgi:S-formylglutathione hydrolase FrmB